MKNIILQHWTGPKNTLVKLSQEAYEEYANRIGSQYRMVEGNVFIDDKTFDPPCQKMCILNEEFDEYDQVLMVDCDQLPVKNLMDNVFEEKGIGVFTDWIKTHAYARIQRTHADLFSPTSPYFSGSFYKLDRETRIKMRQAIDDNIKRFSNKYHDEGIFHYLAAKINLTWDDTVINPGWSQCSYYPVTRDTKMIHIRPKIEPRDDSPRRPKLDTYYNLKMQGVF